MHIRSLPVHILALVAFCLLSTSVSASFHFMQIEQVIGGVNGDVTAQAIQLRQRFGSQNLVQFSRIRAWDAAGINPVIIATFPAAVPNASAGARILITSASFNALTSPACVADRTMTNLIPATYLAAGSLTFEDTGGTIYWRLSWGGAGYTGSGLGSTTNDLDGNFNPPCSGALPSTGTSALKFLNTASALSTNNLADYALNGPAVFNNNAGLINFTVQASNPTGACCLPAGSCINSVQQADCTSQKGVYQGNGELCANVSCPQPSGACCLPDGGCFAGPPIECESSGGEFLGPNSICARANCPQPGACCMPDKSCFQSSTIGGGECFVQGGTYQGNNTLCANVNCNLCPGDIAPQPAGNNVVNVDDLLAVINGWGPCAAPCPPHCVADITKNCAVNVDDLLAVINGWGPCP